MKRIEISKSVRYGVIDEYSEAFEWIRLQAQWFRYREESYWIHWDNQNIMLDHDIMMSLVNDGFVRLGEKSQLSQIAYSLVCEV